MSEVELPGFPLMIFAAGFGTRMGALTAQMPKPLIEVGGKALLDHALDVADAARAGPIVINLHYRGEQIRAHLSQRPDIHFSDETAAILETGGGLRKALPLLGAAGAATTSAVMTLNSDAVWTGQNPLQQLQQAWQPEVMDCLLLLLPVESATGHGGKADFALGADGRIARGGGDETHVYLGAQIIKTARLDSYPDAVFSLNRLWNDMMMADRAFGLVHQGGWCDVGHPGGIALAEGLLRGAGQ